MLPGMYFKTLTLLSFVIAISLATNSNASDKVSAQGLKVTTSANPESNAVSSFIVVPSGQLIPEGIKQGSEQNFLALQIPFVIELPEIPDNSHDIQWQIIIPNRSHGGTRILSKYPGQQKNLAGELHWTSAILDSKVYDRHKLVFRPKPKNHQPGVYKKGKGRNGSRRKYGGGTRNIDDQSFNPRLTYRVKAFLLKNKQPVQSHESIIQMDNKDMIRQEYINHYGIRRYGRGDDGNLPVPRRDEISEIPEKIKILAGNPLTESQYGLLVNDGMRDLAQQIAHSYETQKLKYKNSPLKNLNNQVLDVPESKLWLSGGWRNPERNEWYSNALNGIHQRGGAIDIIISEPPGHPNAAIGYWILWKGLEENREHINGFWQLETNGRPMTTREFKVDVEPENGIPDAFDKADHLHANTKYKEP